MPDGEFCSTSKRVDGKLHSWEFDGDDPRVKCCWCGEIRDALTGKPVEQQPVPWVDPWKLLRELYELSETSVTRNHNTWRKVNAALKQHDAERKSDG